EQTLLQLALSLEAYSTHPISKAIVDYTSKLNISPKHVSDFENITGKGIKGIIDNKIPKYGVLMPKCSIIIFPPLTV
ncbi:hypothetical protein EN816_35365, partial [Mesorhizobium sp. M8A.F.Ca.ET.173.01.1.1]